MHIGHVLGAINTRIILGTLFFLVITPTGLLMLLLGKDPMARRFDQEARSYRVPVDPGADAPMKRPF